MESKKDMDNDISILINDLNVLFVKSPKEIILELSNFLPKNESLSTFNKIYKFIVLLYYAHNSTNLEFTNAELKKKIQEITEILIDDIIAQKSDILEYHLLELIIFCGMLVINNSKKTAMYDRHLGRLKKSAKGKKLLKLMGIYDFIIENNKTNWFDSELYYHILCKHDETNVNLTQIIDELCDNIEYDSIYEDKHNIYSKYCNKIVYEVNNYIIKYNIKFNNVILDNYELFASMHEKKHSKDKYKYMKKISNYINSVFTKNINHKLLNIDSFKIMLQSDDVKKLDLNNLFIKSIKDGYIDYTFDDIKIDYHVKKAFELIECIKDKNILDIKTFIIANDDLTIKKIMNINDLLGCCALEYIFQSDSIEILKLLREYVDLNTCIIKKKYTTRPLIVALDRLVSIDSYNFIEYMIKQGAHLNNSDSEGNTPLHCICSFTHYKHDHLLLNCARLLIESGAFINAYNENCETPLHLACKNNLTDIANLLIKYGAHINAINYNKDTPLHCACEKNAIDIVKLLVEANAEELENNSNDYPYDVAKNYYHEEIVMYLKEKKFTEASQIHSDSEPESIYFE